MTVWRYVTSRMHILLHNGIVYNDIVQIFARWPCAFARYVVPRLRRSSRHPRRHHCHGNGSAGHRVRCSPTSKTVAAATQVRRAAPTVRRRAGRRRRRRRRRAGRLRQGRFGRGALRRPLRQLHAHARCRKLRDVIAESRRRDVARRQRQTIAQRENGEGLDCMTPDMTSGVVTRRYGASDRLVSDWTTGPGTATERPSAFHRAA